MSDPRPPDSEALLEAAFQSAFEKELKSVVDSLPLQPTDRVLDFPCGDGFFTLLLAKRLDDSGRMVAADKSEDCLKQTAERCKKSGFEVKTVAGDAYRAPFEDQSFDAVWCAQSFITLDDPIRALGEMRRIVRPGGIIAVLENDELHHLLLPWPVELEAEIQAAIHHYSREKYGRGAKLCPARTLHRQMKEAGLSLLQRTTYAADRLAPFDQTAEHFLRLHFDFLAKIAQGRLSTPRQRLFDKLIDPRDPTSFLKRDDAELTCLSQLFLARRE